MDRWTVVICLGMIVLGLVLTFRPQVGQTLIELARLAVPVFLKLVEPNWPAALVGVATVAGAVAMAYFRRGQP